MSYFHLHTVGPSRLKAYLLICIGCIYQTPCAAETSPFLNAQDISWKVNSFAVARWKTLVGGNEGGQIDNPDVQFGLWELAPGSTYHGHKHDAPEIYYILSGTAQWHVGEHQQTVTAGSTVYSKPGVVHRMTNLGDTPIQAIWLWWAPQGDRAVFSGDYTFTEPPPTQPENHVPWPNSEVEKRFPES